MSATIPTLLWPSEAHKTPKRCPFCGSGFVCPTPPDSQSRTGETTCGICTRTICTYREAGFTVPASLSRRGAAIRAALCTLCGDRPPVAGRRICKDCRQQQDRDREQAKRVAAKRAAEDEHRAAARRSDAAYRERVRNGQQPRRWAPDHDACIECGQTTRKHHGYGICYGCRNRSADIEKERERRALARAEVAS